MDVPADIKSLADQLDAAESDARALVAGLTEAQGAWRAATAAWSVAECLDHLATANRVYLHAMEGPAVRARAQGKHRRGPATGPPLHRLGHALRFALTARTYFCCTDMLMAEVDHRVCGNRAAVNCSVSHFCARSKVQLRSRIRVGQAAEPK